MGVELGSFQTIDSLFKTAQSSIGTNLVEKSLQNSASKPIEPISDFYSTFHHFAEALIEPLPRSVGIGCRRSFPIPESFTKEEVNQRGTPLINCHIIELLTETQKNWLEGKIISVKSKSKDKKTNRIGFALNTFNKTEQWVKVTSDGEKIFITKNNGYHRTLNPNEIGIEKTHEKIQQILARDTLKRPFGKHLQSEKSSKQVFFQTIPTPSKLFP